MPRMTLAAIAVAIVALTTQADARPKHHVHHRQHLAHKATAPQPRTVIDVAAIPAYGHPGHAVAPSYPMGRQHIAPVRSFDFAEGIVGHPAGCPRRAFCGCGVSVKVFGRAVRELYLARNWLKFPRTSPAAGMVAARSGHVFYIQSVNGDGSVVAYDPNSGGHQTRVHTISLRGFHVVDPNGNPTTFSARKIRAAHR